MEKQTAGRDNLGELAQKFAELKRIVGLAKNKHIVYGWKVYQRYEMI